MAKKDTGTIVIDLDKIKSLPDALKTIEALSKERDATTNTHKNEINALTAKLGAVEKLLAEAKKSGKVSTGAGRRGVSSQYLSVKGR